MLLILIIRIKNTYEMRNYEWNNQGYSRIDITNVEIGRNGAEGQRLRRIGGFRVLPRGRIMYRKMHRIVGSCRKSAIFTHVFRVNE